MSMEFYIKRIESFADEFAYPAEAKAEIVEFFQKAFSNPQDLKALQDCVQSYGEDAGRGFSELLALCAAVANETQVNVYTVYMAAMMLFADVSRKHYEAQGLPYELWKNNFADLTYKLQECKLVKGVWGTFVPTWFCRFYDVSRFAFGKLQFEREPFARTYAKNGVVLDKDSVVINIHLPRTGKKLFPQDVDEACATASAFFQEKYGMERIVFVCHSWLLYPENKKMLNPTSNLYSYIARFDVIEVEESENYRDVWRLFDTEYTGDVDKLPADSSLRRAYIDRIRKGEKTGCGYGVYVYKK